MLPAPKPSMFQENMVTTEMMIQISGCNSSMPLNILICQDANRQDGITAARSDLNRSVTDSWSNFRVCVYLLIGSKNKTRIKNT